VTRERAGADPHPAEDQLSAYLLDELPSAEMDAVDVHLQTCRRCQETLARLDQAFVAAVESLPPTGAPADGWAGIEARLGASDDAGETTASPDAPARRAATDREADADEGSREGAAPSYPAAAPTSVPRRRADAGGWPLAVAASLVLAAVLGGWGAWERQQATRIRAELEALRNRVEVLEAVAGTVQARADEVVSDQVRLARWLARDDVAMTRLPLGGGEVAPGSVLFLPDGRALVVMRSAPEEGRAFQVWGVEADGYASLAVTRELTVEVQADAYPRLAVSVEPEEGSEAPTELLGEVPAG
jgi:anti-sigma factor RsiW